MSISIDDALDAISHALQGGSGILMLNGLPTVLNEWIAEVRMLAAEQAEMHEGYNEK